MAQTLEQRIRKGQEQHRLWIDEDAAPYQVMHSWCNATLELNDSLGKWELYHRIVSWLSAHDDCFHGKCMAKEQA